MSVDHVGCFDASAISDIEADVKKKYVGSATTDTIGFYGKTPIAQRSNAAQATSLVATASSADVTTDLKAAVIEIMNTLTALGLWKGSA